MRPHIELIHEDGYILHPAGLPRVNAPGTAGIPVRYRTTGPWDGRGR